MRRSSRGVAVTVVALLVLAGAGLLRPDDGATGAVPVVDVIDGDTLTVLVDGEPQPVRLAIVDTPELGECGADRATAFTRRWVARRGGEVQLRRPAAAPRRDRHGRLLAEVRAAGDSLNVDLAAAGLAVPLEAYAGEDPDLYARVVLAARGATPVC